MSQVATFKLKCVGCGMVEDRPAESCKGPDGQPYCTRCYMPMVLEKVSIKQAKAKVKA